MDRARKFMKNIINSFSHCSKLTQFPEKFDEFKLTVDDVEAWIADAQHVVELVHKRMDPDPEDIKVRILPSKLIARF